MKEVEESGAQESEESAELLEEMDREIEEENDTFDQRFARHMHATKAWLFASILFTLFLALLISITSDSGTLITVFGFSPTILAVIIYIMLLDGGYKDALFWITPLALIFLFLGLGPFFNEMLSNQLDISVLGAVNLLLSYFILAVTLLIEYRRTNPVSLEESFKPEELDKYVHTIEDKCKALNFVIGRVYRASNGGTKELREKIKISPELYNEFNSIQPEEVREKKPEALDLLGRIKERLSNLLRPEKDSFSQAEIRALKHIARDKDGKDRVLDVLSVNDQDPVEDYFLGAMDFCKRIIAELEKL